MKTTYLTGIVFRLHGEEHLSIATTTPTNAFKHALAGSKQNYAQINLYARRGEQQAVIPFSEVKHLEDLENDIVDNELERIVRLKFAQKEKQQL